MKKNFWISALLLICCFGTAKAQDKKWTMEDCINYAITNNITLQRQRLQTEMSQVNLFKSKMDLLPSINAQSDVSIQYGRSIDPVTNIYTFLQNFRNSYSINTNMSIFNGFAALNTISANKFMYKAGIEYEKIVRNTLILDIMGQYYQVIYTNGLADASKMQLDLSENQLFRIDKMVETGKEALSKKYEIESQVSADRLAYTVALNNANVALTTLRQMLQIQPGEPFDILMPDLNSVLIKDETFSTDSVYNVASETLPRLKAIEFELKANKKQIAAARGRIFPSVGIGASIYTGYFTLLNDTSARATYSRQLKDNFGQGIGASVSIPIFNNYTTGRNIKLAKIKRDDTELRLQQEKNSLYADVENACLNYNRGKDEYAAAGANLEYNKKSYNVIEKKFESGLVNATDFAAAKTTLFRANTEELRTKLQLLIRRLTIQFYTTGEYQNVIQ